MGGVSAAVNGLTLLDWRRRIHGVYAAIRASAEPAEAHARRRRVRDDLFAHHPQSPIASSRRTGFAGLPVAPYDPRWRFELEVDTDIGRVVIEVPTGTGGIVPFERIGVVRLPGTSHREKSAGSLDVWALRSYGDGLFVPLRDRTAGHTTYGAGRYLLDTGPGKTDVGSVEQ